jgi:chromosome segregation ATPase
MVVLDMEDERDLRTRQVARQDHAVWLSQHAAWAAEVEEWLRRLDAHAGTLDRLREELGRERARIEKHLEGIRRHEAAIMEHDFVLAELDGGTCGGCEEAEPPAHARASATHAHEATVHSLLAERQEQIASHLSRLGELLGQ